MWFDYVRKQKVEWNRVWKCPSWETRELSVLSYHDCNVKIFIAIEKLSMHYACLKSCDHWEVFAIAMSWLWEGFAIMVLAVIKSLNCPKLFHLSPPFQIPNNHLLYIIITGSKWIIIFICTTTIGMPFQSSLYLSKIDP